MVKNVLHNPAIRIDAGGAEAELKATPITDAKQVSSVVEKFRREVPSRQREEVLFQVRRCRPRSDRLMVRRSIAVNCELRYMNW